MVTDPVADMLVTIKNGYMAKCANVVVPFSKHKLDVAKVLAQRNFITSAVQENSKIKIELAYENQKPKLTNLKRISKPGLRIYIKSKNIKKVKGGRGMLIISSPSGVISAEEAKQKKLGGEVICQVW